ncbi:MAG: TetR/AcrR family transcriptional regulator [Alphaproteobacteria bacterium]|nr:MAG: TetR/AcrR family transcriptional regulator [Alphaproteobacteria bacterium]
MRHLNLSPEVKNPKSSKGLDTRRTILEAALEIFIEHGYGDFSLEKVAANCGLSRGNVCYYYPTKNDMLHALLQSVVQGYLDEFDEVVLDQGLSAEDKFLKIVEMIMSDLGTEETSKFFPELWALSNRNKMAMKEMNLLYQRAREHLNGLLAEINPDLTPKEVELIGLFISASMEGQTPFVGNGKEFQGEIVPLTRIAAFSFLTLAKTITTKDIDA